MAESPRPGVPGPERAGPPPDEPAEVLLLCAFDLSTLVALRHEVQHVCQLQGLTDLALYRFVVAVNEVTTNAVRHGGGSGRLQLWRAGGRLYCRVADRGSGISMQAGQELAPPDKPDGRGLWLARHNTGRFTLHTGAGGTTITLMAT
ncbi:ATP-binding protein [Nonomuraea sp. NPDC002799]